MHPRQGPSTGGAFVTIQLKDTPPRSAWSTSNPITVYFGGATNHSVPPSNSWVRNEWCYTEYCESVSVSTITPEQPFGRYDVRIVLALHDGSNVNIEAETYLFEDTSPSIVSLEPSACTVRGHCFVEVAIRYLFIETFAAYQAQAGEMLTLQFGANGATTNARFLFHDTEAYVTYLEIYVPPQLDFAATGTGVAGRVSVPLHLLGQSEPLMVFNFTYTPDTTPRIKSISPLVVSAIGGVAPAGSTAAVISAYEKISTITLHTAYFPAAV